MNTWINHNLKDRQTNRRRLELCQRKWSQISPPSWPAHSSSTNLLIQTEPWITEILHLIPNSYPVQQHPTRACLEGHQCPKGVVTSSKDFSWFQLFRTPHTPPCCSVQLWSCNHKGAQRKCDFPASFHSKFCFINSFKLIITTSMLNCSWELTLWCKNLLKAETWNLGNQFSKKYSIIAKKPNHNQNPQKTQSTQKQED